MDTEVLTSKRDELRGELEQAVATVRQLDAKRSELLVLVERLRGGIATLDLVLKPADGEKEAGEAPAAEEA